MSGNDELLKGIWAELREIKSWLKLSGLPIIRKAIQENLRDDESKSVYELSDGNRSTREIAAELEKTGMTIVHGTVANMWRRWAMTGIVEPSERYQGRFKKLVSLDSLGIETPVSLKENESSDE